MVRLDELCDINPPRPRLGPVDEETEVLFVPMAAVDETSGTITAPETSTVRAVGHKSYRSFTSGDVLFAKITPCMENGKSAIVPEIPSGLGFGSTEFHVMRPRPGTDARLLWHLVRQRSFRDEATNHFTGSVGQLRVPADFLRSFETAVPTESIVQHRLADMLDKATSLFASSQAHLLAAHRSTERFRRAVLVAACSGRLTEDWRTVESLPEWDVDIAANVCDKVQSGGTPKSGFIDTAGAPFLKVYNLVGQRVNFDYRPQFVPHDVHNGVLRKSVAYPGDVIMNIVGPPLGKVAIVPGDFPEWNLNQAITLFRPGKRLLKDWLYYYLRSGVFMDEDLITRGSAGQSNISLTQCRRLLIPIPSLGEQAEIVRRVAELLAIADEITSRVEVASRRVDQSSQAALAKAFRGELRTTNLTACSAGA